MPRSARKYKRYLGLALLSLALTMVATVREPAQDWHFAFTPIAPPPVDQLPLFETVFDYEYPGGNAHAPAIISHQDGFSIVWFQGSREAAIDVEIFRANFGKTDGTWQADPPATVLGRASVTEAMHPDQSVLILGNTIAYKPGDPGRYLATVVSLGGWAMASIADIKTKNGAPVAARRLNLSPLLNRSHLVRGPTLMAADGDILVPAYFEMGNGFGELLRLGKDGRVRDKRRLSNGRLAIQPMIVPVDGNNAVALMRSFDGQRHLVAVWTKDGGNNWSPPKLLDLPNPNSPVAAIALKGRRILMAFNDDNFRTDLLSLAVSDDLGRSWQRIATLEDHNGAPGQAVRYPAMQRLANGDILLTYSHSSKKGIRAHVFNETWINSQ